MGRDAAVVGRQFVRHARERVPKQREQVPAARGQKLEVAEIAEQGLAEVPAENPQITKGKKYGRGGV